MNPITFTCEESLPLAPEDIAQQILDLTRWPEGRHAPFALSALREYYWAADQSKPRR